MGYTTADNNYATARFIVGLSGQANYTTITAALNDASSGNTIFLLPGTYNENLVLKAGVDLASYEATATSGNVRIVGTLNASFTGQCSLSGIELVTNSANFLSVTGNNATVVRISNCRLTVSNNTGINFTSSSTSSRIFINYCTGDIGTTGITYWASLSAGNIICNYSVFSNSGGSTTASSNTAGTVSFTRCVVSMPITVSNIANVTGVSSTFDTSSVNAVSITTSGTGVNNITTSTISSGTATAVSAGSLSTVSLVNCAISSSNAATISGAGTLNYAGLEFSSTKVITTSVQNAGNGGTFTPVLTLGGGTTGITYGGQQGAYLRTDNTVFFRISIALSSKGTDTGQAILTGLPYNLSGGTTDFSLLLFNPGVAVANATGFFGELLTGTSELRLLVEQAATTNFASLTDADLSNSAQLRISGTYLI